MIEACKVGVVGAFPSLNCRSSGKCSVWLDELSEKLSGEATPFAVNPAVHKSNTRLESDLDVTTRSRVPVVITSLGFDTNVVAAIKGYGGIVFHDVIYLVRRPRGRRHH